MTFSIAGDVGGLFPGAVKPLSLLVSNPFPDPIRVVSLSTTVGTPDRAGCTATVLTVSGLGSPVDIPPGQSRPVGVDVTMAATAPDACQGARFPLTYSGTAEGTSTTPATPTRLDALTATALGRRAQPVVTGHFTARATTVSPRKPIAELTVQFSVSGTPVCQGTTNRLGFATCSGTFVAGTSSITVIRYTASFAGNSTYAASTATANVVVARRP